MLFNALFQSILYNSLQALNLFELFLLLCAKRFPNFSGFLNLENLCYSFFFISSPFSLKTKHSTQTQKLLPTFTQNFTVLHFPFLKQKLPLQFPQFLPLISFYSSQFLLTKTRLPSLTPLFLSFQFQHPRSLSLSPLFSLSCISTHNTLPSSLFFFFSVQHFLSSLSALFCSHSSVCS